MFLDELLSEHAELLGKMKEFRIAAEELMNGNFVAAQRMLNYISEEVIGKHFTLEEQGLFPVFEPVLARHLPREEPLRMLRLEHLAVQRKEEEVRERVAKAEPQEASKAALQLLDMLQQHVFREENGVFPMARRYLDESQKMEVQKKIQELLRSMDPVFQPRSAPLRTTPSSSSAESPDHE
ncbi:MAG: hemerythrin domain-containing protein [Thermoprotei archaeon]|nr:hemerythrin domain-containing protein [TACK group archaeon]